MIFRKKLSVFIPAIVLSYIVFFAVSSDDVNAGFDCWWSGKEDCGPNNKCTVVGDDIFLGEVYSCEYCKPGFGDCDGTGGCKISFLNDPDNCGGCLVKCRSNQFCYLGECEHISETETETETEIVTETDTLICGGKKCDSEDTCSSSVPCKKQVNISCIDANGNEECGYKLATDDSCIELCSSRKCDNGNCVEPEPIIECYEDYVGADCMTYECYSGKLTRECIEGTFGKEHCKAITPNVFQCKVGENCIKGQCVKAKCTYGDVKYDEACVTADCNIGKWEQICESNGMWEKGNCIPTYPLRYTCPSKEKCVDGECVSDKKETDTKPERESRGILKTLIWIIVIIGLIGFGGYAGYYYYLNYLSKSKAKTVKPTFVPTYIPRLVSRRPVEKRKIREIVQKRRKAKRTKREKFLKTFDEESKEKIPKKTKK